MKHLSIAITATVLLALGPVGAQEESRDLGQDKSANPQLTLQIEERSPHRFDRDHGQKNELSRVRETPARPHGRSRVDPAPPPKPLIDPKRM